MPRSSQLLSAMLTLTVLGLAALAWNQRLEIRQLRKERAQKPDAHAPQTAARGIGKAGASLSRATAVPVGRPSRERADFSFDDQFGGAPTARKPIPARQPANLSRLMGDPQFVRAFSLHQEGALDSRFAALFRQLNLTADELAAFKRLLVEKDSVALDVVAISQESPDGPLPANELRSSIAAAQSQVENAIQASLGNERYAVYRDYERTISQRALVARLEQRLSYTASPLQPSQAESLVRILAREAPAEAAPSRPAIAVLAGAAAPEDTPIVHTAPAAAHVTESVIAESQTVLSPPQIAALRQLNIEMGASEQATQILNALLPPNSFNDDLRPGLQILLP